MNELSVKRVVYEELGRWTKMKEWVAARDPGDDVDGSKMTEELGLNWWETKFRPLCRMFPVISNDLDEDEPNVNYPGCMSRDPEHCSCPLSYERDMCGVLNSNAWGAVNTAETWGQWAVACDNMIGQLSSLLDDWSRIAPACGYKEGGDENRT